MYARTRKWLQSRWLRLKLRYSLLRRLVAMALTPALDVAQIQAAASLSLSNFLLDSEDNRRGQLGTGEILDIAAMAHAFTGDPYWRRMTIMLKNTETAEMETLLDPTSTHDQQVLSRASVANIRKLLVMPYIDIAQGDAAVKAVERHQERFGETEWTIAQRGVRQPQDA